MGFDTSSTRALDGSSPCAEGAGYETLHPVLTDVGPAQFADATGGCELLVNAVIQPSNLIKFGKLKRDAKRGTATQKVKVPGPGELALSGKGVARRATTVDRAGGAKLKIKSSGRTKRKLAAAGKVKVKVSVTFSPAGGDPNTAKRKVKLKKRV